MKLSTLLHQVRFELERLIPQPDPREAIREREFDRRRDVVRYRYPALLHLDDAHPEVEHIVALTREEIIAKWGEAIVSELDAPLANDTASAPPPFIHDRDWRDADPETIAAVRHELRLGDNHE